MVVCLTIWRDCLWDFIFLLTWINLGFGWGQGALLAKPEDFLSLCCVINHSGFPLSPRNSPVLPNDKRLMSLLSAPCAGLPPISFQECKTTKLYWTRKWLGRRAWVSTGLLIQGCSQYKAGLYCTSLPWARAGAPACFSARASAFFLMPFLLYSWSVTDWRRILFDGWQSSLWQARHSPKGHTKFA